MINIDQRMYRHQDWASLTEEEKFEDVCRRMDNTYNYVTRRSLRERYASPEQFKDEYPEDWETAVSAVFQMIKSDYEEIREYVLNNKDKSKNPNIIVMEKILMDDAERILLEGDNDE